VTRKLNALALLALAVVLVIPASGSADPAGKTTLEETIDIQLGEGFQLLRTQAGEPYATRKSKLGSVRGDRAKRRRSLIFFGQFTDPQIADEMTPPRLDFLDEADNPLQDGVRPQESLETQLFDQMVRNMNANRTSAVKPAKGKNARLQFTINTGDMADSQQYNETRWVVDILDGKTVDPFSGKPISPTNPCQQNDETVARLNADVAARRYTGLQDYDDYDAPDARKQAYWDPDAAPPGGAGPYAGWPRYPGLLERAQQPFQAEGVAVPWYTARGNHDGLVTGNVYATFSLARSLILGCQKVFPSANFDPNIYRGKTEAEVFDDIVKNPSRTQEILAGIRPVPPDPDRHYVDQREYKALHDTGDNSHGYGFVDKTELKRSNGAASYYAFNPRSGFRFVSLDTVAEGGGSDGNVDDPQYEWFKRELDRSSSLEWNGKRLVRDGDRDRLIVVYSHHKLDDLTITSNDEASGACENTTGPAGCDRDPRKSTPIHRGLKGKETIRDLMLKYPNVIAFVTGHSHKNAIDAYTHSSRRSGFWQINTASHVDFPQQSRQIEVVDNRDGTLSIFNTIIDHAAPVNPPAPGSPANVFTDTELASLGRVIAANDPQGLGPRGHDSRENAGLGERLDRNVELPIRDPRALGR
jgi:metallophosphoesterase (TIGR03767 family)